MAHGIVAVIALLIATAFRRLTALMKASSVIEEGPCPTLANGALSGLECVGRTHPVTAEEATLSIMPTDEIDVLAEHLLPGEVHAITAQLAKHGTYAVEHLKIGGCRHCSYPNAMMA
jgi:hypothetical protein